MGLMPPCAACPSRAGIICRASVHAALSQRLRLKELPPPEMLLSEQEDTMVNCILLSRDFCPKFPWTETSHGHEEQQGSEEMQWSYVPDRRRLKYGQTPTLTTLCFLLFFLL